MPSSTTFYRKYRPQKFSDVIGQKHIVTTLENALKLGKVGQAYLFTGPRGTGKTTLARLFAKAINCENRKGAEACDKCRHCLLMHEGQSFDIIEIDAASHTGVDNIRELRETVNLPPSLGSHKVYIIDEVHMLSIGAFNALLKTLEEPPAHVVFILATTALHKVPDTIVSRCQRFDLTRFPVKDITRKLTSIAKEEKLKITPEALAMIAFSAEGGMRDAESLLMQVASLGLSPITEDIIIGALGTTKKQNVTTLITFLADNDLYGALSFIREVSQSGAELSLYASLVLHFLRDLLIVNTNAERGLLVLGELTEEERRSLTTLAPRFTAGQIVLMLEQFQIAQSTTKSAVITELPLEIAVVNILAPREVAPTPREPGTPTVTATSHEKKVVPKINPMKSSDAGAKQFHRANPDQSNEVGPPEAEFHRASQTEIPKKEYTKTATEINTDQTIKEEVAEKTARFDLSHIKEHWLAILDTAKRLNASLTLGLSTARPVETTGSTIVIAVKYPFHKERLEEAANQLTLEKAFDTILGAKMKLVIVLDSAKNEAVAQEENPLISQALSMLGGRVVNEA